MKIYMYGTDLDNDFCFGEIEVKETKMMYKSADDSWMSPACLRQVRKNDEGIVRDCDTLRPCIFFTERQDELAQARLHDFYMVRYNRLVLEAEQEKLQANKIVGMPKKCE